MIGIAAAGFQHETNPFGATKADFADFAQRGGHFAQGGPSNGARPSEGPLTCRTVL